MANLSKSSGLTGRCRREGDIGNIQERDVTTASARPIGDPVTDLSIRSVCPGQLPTVQGDPGRLAEGDVDFRIHVDSESRSRSAMANLGKGSRGIPTVQGQPAGARLNINARTVIDRPGTGDVSRRVVETNLGEGIGCRIAGDQLDFIAAKNGGPTL